MVSCTQIVSLSLLLWGGAIAPVAAFAPINTRTSVQTDDASKWYSRRSLPALFESNKDDSGNTDTDNSLFQRFLDPRIDDPGLPLTEVLIAQIVAPTIQIYWISLVHAPSPTWLQPINSYFGQAPELAPRGYALAPTLIHGAGLAVCWLAGALAARSFEREAFTVKEIDNKDASGGGILGTIGRYDTILFRLFQAGAFASGILILSTQTDLLLEFGRYIQYGESDETDLRLAVATVEVINDIFFEALVIGSWRIIHANFMSTPTNWSKRF